MDFETPACFGTEADAIAHAREMIGDYGGQLVIYKCSPVKYVYRGRIQVSETPRND